MLPHAGDVLRLTRAASPQFTIHSILFRVIRVHPYDTYDGWVWLDGYELDQAGDAVERRSLFLMVDGLQVIQTQPRRAVRRPAAAAERACASRR